MANISKDLQRIPVFCLSGSVFFPSSLIHLSENQIIKCIAFHI